MAATIPPPLDERASSYSWYVLSVLCLVYLSNHIDRSILMILLQPVKEEFGASDLQMGLLTGPAFALFYAVAGIPIARWADRGSRKSIIALSVAIWSVMTALSGAARGFVTLAILRVGVGIGEAGCSPPSHSMIVDYFPSRQRARALAIYATGTQLGSAFGWLIGGWLYLYFGWRYTFVAVGVPGVLLALLVAFSVKEPARGRAAERQAEPGAEPLTDTLRSLVSQRSYAWLQAGGALHAMAAYGFGVWVAPFLIRVHGLEIHVLGTWLGGIALLAGVPGVYLGGYLCDRLVPRDARWYLWIPILAAVCAIPFTLLFLFLSDPTWAFAAYTIHTVFTLAYSAPVYAMTQSVVKVRERSLAVAVHLFVVNLIGLGIGPVLVGALNDALEPAFGQVAIRYTMLVAAITNLLACGFYLMAARTVKRDIARRQQ